ncbi:FecR family protein [Sphingorhabdus sp. EL138]|uniref:FecR family protein n=1 Tax=Sphingorhabdus sp. EL138 TaxID=2073156 RepID=UPI000D68AE58|nr:FecR family protein [Sphingorhabdus sp. EL138]
MHKLAKFIAIAAFATGTTAHGATPEWKLSESNGTVNILRSGVSKIAIAGGDLRPGDVIRTGKKGRAVLVRGQEYVVVSPNSRLRISEPKKSGGVMQFFEELGNVIFRIDKKGTPHFGVKTPYLAAVVKGTTFSVTVTETGSAVQVTEGAVQVSTLDGGATQLLSPGMIGMVKNGDQFRLSITGSEEKTIISPNGPAESSGTTASEDVIASDIATGGFEGIIEAPVSESPVSLSELTGGLVNSGSSTKANVQMASVNAPNLIDLALSNASTNGVPGTFGNGNGGGNGNSSGNANNGNAGGNGNGGRSANASNGNTAGNGNTNGGGSATASNGNAAGNGNTKGGGSANASNGNTAGNGNANGGGSATASNGNTAGNGNANGGGSANASNGNTAGNGNAKGGGSANASNGNTAGNGNANGGGNGNGNNGNGNGGSNGGGNGNGNSGKANGHSK